MPKLLPKATEMTDTQVDFVSLVKRGANRIPFRIFKRDDEEMLDLYAVGRRMFQKADPLPSVVAIVTQKADPRNPKLAAVAKACGMPATLKLQKSEDGVAILAAEGAKLDGAVLVKLDKNIAVAVAGSSLRKAFPDHEFVAGPEAARRAMNRAIKDALAKSEVLDRAADVVRKATEDFATHMALLQEHMPEAGFKADQARRQDSPGRRGTGFCGTRHARAAGRRASWLRRSCRPLFAICTSARGWFCASDASTPLTAST